jgi:hypothetical protein
MAHFDLGFVLKTDFLPDPVKQERREAWISASFLHQTKCSHVAYRLHTEAVVNVSI